MNQSTSRRSASFERGDLVDLASLTREDLFRLLDRAIELRELEPTERQSIAMGREIVQLFLEPSTRTKLSFEIAAKRLGATVIDFEADLSSLTKGESILDTVKTIEAMGTDVLVVRNREEGTSERLARHCRGAVVNAGDGTRAHPTQGLLDLLTLREVFPDLSGRRVGIVGDLRHSRVAGSDIEAFTKAGATVLLISPEALRREEVPPADHLFAGEIQEVTSFDEAIPTLDAVVMLRVQRERIASDLKIDDDRYISEYQLNRDRLDRLPEHAIVMHPGPMNREVEIEGVVADGPRSKILRQVANGVAVRMAVLEHALNRVPSVNGSERCRD